MVQKRLFLIDGSSFIYRAFYALPSLSSSKGIPTNAVYGFARMLNRILKEHKPEYMAVVFDAGRETFRTEKFKEYKAHRPKMPAELAVQLPYIKKLTELMGIPVIELEGFEADDIIATLSEKAKEEGFKVVIVSPDKDLLQLIDKDTVVYDPLKHSFFSELEVVKKFGVPPHYIPDLLALVGDKSDNVPGVKGVGKKTAIELINRLGSLEEIYRRLDSVKPSVKKRLVESKDEAFLSKELVTVRRDVDVPVGVKELKIRKPDWEALKKLYMELEFHSLLKEIPEDAGKKKAESNYAVIQSIEELEELLSRNPHEISIDFETTSLNPHDAEIVGIAISTREGKGFYIPLAHREKSLPKEEVLTALKEAVFNNPKTIKVGQNLKYEMAVLLKENLTISPPIFDTMIASYLLNPTKKSHKLDNLALELLGYHMQSYKEVTSKLKKGEDFSHLPLKDAVFYACEDADITLRLKRILEKRLKEEELTFVFEEIELPLIGVLAKMEFFGIKVDPIKLELMSKFLEEKIRAVESDIYRLAGEKFNINSPKQLSSILFEKLKLPPVKKTKTGFSTDTEVLEVLSLQHPLPAKVLEYRQLAKLRSTYVEGLIKKIHPRTGRVHTSFNQTATATGRLSSSEPNLQNIPIRTDLGRLIRETFIAEEGYTFVSADYSQIELRILAALAEEEKLIEAFKKGEDIHTRTACEIFGVNPEEVTPNMRRHAKTVNFGIIYGMSPYGLSKELGISIEEAKAYIERYFERYPRVVEFINKTIESAQEKGFVKTFFGRKRPVPELLSSRREEREFGKRIAVNTPIQGTAADLIKLAMIKMDSFIEKSGIDARMLLQVHDELLFEVKDEEAEEFAQHLKKIMEGICPELGIPLKVDVKMGKDWGKL